MTTPDGTPQSLARLRWANAKPVQPRQCQGPGCNVVFTPGAPWGKYCSNACRQRAKRKRKSTE